MAAPYITHTTFFPLKNTVKRYDAYERGKRKKVGGGLARNESGSYGVYERY